jgi:hypothetical protein
MSAGAMPYGSTAAANAAVTHGAYLQQQQQQALAVQRQMVAGSGNGSNAPSAASSFAAPQSTIGVVSGLTTSLVHIPKVTFSHVCQLLVLHCTRACIREILLLGTQRAHRRCKSHLVAATENEHFLQTSYIRHLNKGPALGCCMRMVLLVPSPSPPPPSCRPLPQCLACGCGFSKKQYSPYAVQLDDTDADNCGGPQVKALVRTGGSFSADIEGGTAMEYIGGDTKLVSLPGDAQFSDIMFAVERVANTATITSASALCMGSVSPCALPPALELSITERISLPGVASVRCVHEACTRLCHLDLCPWMICLLQDIVSVIVTSLFENNGLWPS